MLGRRFRLTIYVLVLDRDLSPGVAEELSNVLRDNNASMMAYSTKYTDGSFTSAFADTLGHEIHHMGDYLGGQRVFKYLPLDFRIGPSEPSKGPVLMRISDSAAIDDKGNTIGDPVFDSEANKVDFHVVLAQWLFRGPHNAWPSWFK